jgi:hypothetical protein
VLADDLADPYPDLVFVLEPARCDRCGDFL